MAECNNTKGFKESMDAYFSELANQNRPKLHTFKTAKDGFKSDKIIKDCFVCLEDFSEFDLDYIQCKCGEKICMDCVKYKFEQSGYKHPKCPHCKIIWGKDIMKNLV